MYSHHVCANFQSRVFFWSESHRDVFGRETFDRGDGSTIDKDFRILVIVHPKHRIGRNRIQFERLTKPNTVGGPSGTDASTRGIALPKTSVTLRPMGVIKLRFTPTFDWFDE